MATIDYQPWYQNCTSPAWDIPLLAGGQPDDLTGVNLAYMTMTFRSAPNNQYPNGNDVLGTGTFTLKTAYPAEVYYKPSPADVALPFSGFLFIKCFFPPSNSNLDAPVWDPIGGVTPGSPFVILAS